MGRVIKFFYFFIILFISNVCWSQQGISINIDDLSTSDDLSVFYYGLNVFSSQKNLIYPYENEDDSNLIYSANYDYYKGSFSQNKFESNELTASIGYVFNNHSYLNATIGSNYFKNSNSNLNAKKNSVYSLSYESVLFKNLYFQITNSKDNLFKYGYVPGPVLDNTTQNILKLNLKYTINDKIKYNLSYNYFSISDGNIKTQFISDLMYGLSVWPTWFWIGVGVEHINNKKNMNYWSPDKFKALSLKLDYNYKLIKLLSFSISLNLSAIKENDLNWGDAYYLNAGLRYGERESHNIFLGYEGNRSSQSTNRWNLDKLYLKLYYYF